MATTKIWDVNSRLERLIDYASNPEKTENKSDMDYHYNGLGQTLSYTTNDLKTEKQLYVSGINCSYATALEDMMLTKKAFNKMDGILAFHAIQSFNPGEVDAELAHQIGIELANYMWGDRFEVLVATHLDKAHYHNHFVINSVSFKDGKRYYDNRHNYYRLREVSDQLCEKYNLSVIENPQDTSLHYSEWKCLKEKKLSERELVRRDVEEAIARARSKKEFFKILEEMGYTLRFGKKYISLKHKDSKRAFRLQNLTKDGSYEMENILIRIYQKNPAHFEEPRHTNKIILKGDFKNTKKITGFRALYFRYLYLLGVLPKHSTKQRIHPLIKRDLLKLDQITEEVTFMGKKQINTYEDFFMQEKQTQTSKNDIEKQRRCLYNKVKRCHDIETKDNLQQQIDSLTNQIKSLRKEVVLYERIKKRSKIMEDKMKQIKESEKEENQNDNRWRNRRSNDKDDLTRY